MKTVKIAFMAIALSFAVASCMQNAKDVDVEEDKIEAPADETKVDEPEIPVDEEMEEKIKTHEGMDSDEDPIMDTMQ